MPTLNILFFNSRCWLRFPRYRITYSNTTFYGVVFFRFLWTEHRNRLPVSYAPSLVAALMTSLHTAHVQTEVRQWTYDWRHSIDGVGNTPRGVRGLTSWIKNSSFWDKADIKCSNNYKTKLNYPTAFLIFKIKRFHLHLEVNNDRRFFLFFSKKKIWKTTTPINFCWKSYRKEHFSFPNKITCIRTICFHYTYVDVVVRKTFCCEGRSKPPVDAFKPFCLLLQEVIEGELYSVSAKLWPIFIYIF